MIRFVSSVIVLLVFVLSVQANYVYRNGYYYWGDNPQAYTRSQQYGYYNGCYCYYYNYTPYYAPAAAYVAPTTPATVPVDWETRIVDAHIALNKQKAFMDALSTLPQQTAVQVAQSTYGYQQKYQQPYFAPQASTTYSHVYNERTTFWGDVDQMALHQSGFRLTENLQRIMGESMNNQTALLSQIASNARESSVDKARVAEIVAKAQALAIALDASSRALQEKKIVIENNGVNTRVVPNQPAPNPNPVPAESPRNPQESSSLDKLGALFVRDCAMCHGETKKEGKLDLRDWPSFDSARKMKIYLRVTTDDQDKAMPRTKDGGVGKRWTQDEAKLLLTN